MRKISWSLALAGWLTAAGWAEGKVWAVVVGIDEYVRPSIPKLRYAVADAKLFAQALKDGLQVAPENMFLMTSDTVDENLQPRVVNLAYRLGWLAEHVKKDDTVIFYFAGHGMTVEGQPFLLTEEADNRSASTLRVSALNGGEVIGWLRKAQPANVWVVLDACRNSPGSKQELRLAEGLTGAFSHADVGRDRSATMFACNLGERSWELDEVKHGCYTYFLVDGLRRGAADPGGQVTLQGLFDYAAGKVKVATEKLGTAQNPRLFYGGASSNEWVLARVKAGPTVASGGHSTAQYVARLEMLQAKLDKETALRVAAEQKARSEESRRLELEQRVALMEKQLNSTQGLSGPASKPQTLAYAERGVQDPEAMAKEITRLLEENRKLSRRLTELEGDLAKVGMVPRDVTLVEALAREKGTEEALRGSTPELDTCLQIRDSQARQIEFLEKAYGEQLAARPQPKGIATEVEVLRAQLGLQRKLTGVCREMYKAARQAASEADLRYQETLARLQVTEEKLRLSEEQRRELELKVARASDERDALRRRAERLAGELEAAELEASERFRHYWEDSDGHWRVRGRRILSDVLRVLPSPPEAQTLKSPQR